MKRLFLLTLGLAMAAAAFYAAVPGRSARPVAAGPPPLDEIDDASRARLRGVLRDAAAAEGRQP